MTREFGRSKDVFIHQTENQSYENMPAGQTNFDNELTPELRAQAKPAVKDEYLFDIPEMNEEFTKACNILLPHLMSGEIAI